MDMTDRMDASELLMVPCAAESGDGTFRHHVTGHFEIENPPLRTPTLLFVGTRGRLRRYLKDEAKVDIRKDAVFDAAFRGVGGLTFPCTDGDGADFVVVWLPKFEWSVTDMETLSHECLHASVMVMRMSGQKPRIFSAKGDSDVDDEGLAYRQSAMFAAMLTEMARKQQKSYRRAIRASKGV